jgi:DNA repair protein RecO (recombination protein O)
VGGAPPGQIAEALVLSSAESRDDRIVTLFVRDLGRVPALARGARKSTRRFGGHIDPLTLTEVTLRLRPSHDLALLERASSRHAFPVLKGDLKRLALAMTMAEVILQVVAEHDHEPALWTLTHRAWTHLDDPRRPPTRDLLALFELRVLEISGYLPDLAELPQLPKAARPVLAAWLGGHWEPLPPGTAGEVGRLLEGLLREVSGRPLRSLAFLEEAFS